MPTSFTVGSEADLNAALAQIDVSGASSAPSTAYTIALSGSITLSTDLDAINLAPGATLAIQGNGHTLDGGDVHRGLFAYAGGVTVSNLAIDNARATGGLGYGGGGAGAGLGGGLFVASGASVSLDGVTFSGDGAVGGSELGGLPYEGGGGGLGGAAGSRGGGGVGLLAAGDTGGPGIVIGAAPGGSDTAGDAGGANGGGGGGGTGDYVDTGGGGGVGGGTAVAGFSHPGASGGFGGGGAENGNGGFGGGGGIGGNGGFGGGSGYGGAPGFGGGASYSNARVDVDSGGVGLGAGGAIFVQQGGGLTLASGTIGGGTALDGRDFVDQQGPGLGAGLFLQGSQQIALAPSAGQTLAIGDAITDQTGSLGQTGLSAAGDPLAGAGSLLVEGPGRVVLSAASSSSTLTLGETYSGGTTLTGGTLELALRGPLGSGDVAFAGPATLVLDAAPGNGPGAFSRIDGFAPGDVIDFRSLYGTTSYGSGTYEVQQDPAHPENVFIANGGSGDLEQLNITGAHDLQLGVAADGSLTLFEAPCFARGTRIDTPGGTAAVEDLAPGDRVLLATGGSAPVRWVGHRRVDLRRHPRPETARPVRVRAGAFGPGLPRRDLLLSPEHALLLGGALVPVRVLLDGAAVAQESPERVTYFHVELDRHGVILAEGLPAESYLDTGNRDGFANGAVTSLHPDFAPGHAPAEPCAPMALAGPEVEAARATLRLWGGTQEASKRVLS
ncbi:MAG: Hint domain-containing protein [Janthinobacterium lividum]